MSRPRILFFAEAVTLAHVGRCVALARSLDPEAWEIRLAADPRQARAVGALPFPVESIWTISAEHFNDALARGSPIYGAAALHRYVLEDLRVIKSFRPDIVVGDFRISLAISSRLATVPYINVTNAYWSPMARIRHVVPEFNIARMLPLKLAQTLFDVLRPLGYAMHALPVNKVRSDYGIEPLPLDFRWALIAGDITLFADIPEVIPTSPLPATQRLIGPIPWSPSVSLPAWWEAAGAAATRRPLVYVNLGSSGTKGALPRIVAALASMPVTVVAATAGRSELLPSASNCHVADYLPGDACASLASVVVCNGGSPAVYQALAAGKPVIGLAANTDQFLNMAAVNDAGYGILLRAHSATGIEFRDSVVRALDDHRLAIRARTAANAIALFDPTANFRVALGDAFYAMAARGSRGSP